MNNTDKILEASMPVFKEMCDNFQDVINTLLENSNVIYNKVNSISDKAEPTKEELKSKSPSSVVEQLWQYIYTLRDINYTLSKSRENLQELVG